MIMLAMKIPKSMKKITTLMISVLFCLHGLAQEKTTEPSKAGKKFFAGISYSYMNIDTKLRALSLHSVWDGQDLGTDELTEDEVSLINSIATRTNRMNDLSLHIGMKILDKPGSKWIIEGTLMAGLARFSSNVYNTETGVQEYLFNSGFSKPTFGISFEVGYRFTSHWGISLKPS